MARGRGAFPLNYLPAGEFFAVCERMLLSSGRAFMLGGICEKRKQSRLRGL